MSAAAPTPPDTPAAVTLSPEELALRRARVRLIALFFLERFKERSTWLQMIAFFGPMLGSWWKPEYAGPLVTIGSTAALLIGIVTVEAKKAVEGTAAAASQAADPTIPVQAIGDPPLPTEPPRGT